MEIWVQSSIDHSKQPSLFYSASKKNSPLLVILHTWSFDRYNQINDFLPYQKSTNWNMLFPEFRGPNLNSNQFGHLACGSLLAKQDIIDAIDYVKKHNDIDEEKIMLVGSSGGGHMALLMAAYRPHLFSTIIANCSVTDLSRWRNENSNYKKHVEYCLAGPPSKHNINDYKYRSPIFHASEIAKAKVKIIHGKHDQSVPFSHSLNLYNQIIKENYKAFVTLEINELSHEWIIDKIIKDLKKSTILNSDSTSTITK
ncbi:MAG: DUF2920 family protein [Clostridiales bacterium]|nr:DUF2920 family protein [Clostridiales bacterium]